MKTIKIYNTLSEKKEILKKKPKGNINIFVCGPTVYDFTHLGHARTYLVFDALVKYLRNQGFKIFYLQNITNVDDKIINRAKEQKINPFKLAHFFEKKYYEDLKKLNITSVNKYARASDYLKAVISQVKTLIKKGYAYEIKDNGYYFDISKFKDYGKLSKRTVAQAEDAFSRIDENINKKNKGDFCLWKFVKVSQKTKKNKTKKLKKYPLKIFNGEPAWLTELGWGRPGWHIEDTAITETFFGPQYDLHGGAVELKFPHHEAEIAQQEAASSKKPLVKIWMHTGLLTVNGQKMSKSLKNFITVNNFLKKYPAESLRWFILNFHYRSPIDYQEALFKKYQQSFLYLKNFIKKLNFLEKKIKNKSTKKEIKNIIQNFEKKFHQTLQDDYNTPQALASAFEFINKINSFIFELSEKDIKNIKKTILKNLKTLGFIKINEPYKIPEKIKKMLEKRELLRTNKQFIPADRLRNKINQLGYIIEDTPFGPFVYKK